jgi:hypothetical protein
VFGVIEYRRVRWLAVVMVLLAGVLMRWYYLAEMSRLLLYDEAFVAVDAFSLLHQPRFVPFFPDNLGAESLWHYALVPLLAVFGAEPFTLRIAATFTGILTIAAVYAFANIILGRRGALWATLGFGVLYWHVHLSYIAFRSILLPLIGALAFVVLFKAFRRNRHWYTVGILFSLLAYIYFPGTVWLGFGVLMQVWWFVFHKDKRRGIALSLLLTGLLILPITVYVLTSPHFALKRAAMTAVPDFNAILQNIGAWINAWFGQWGEQPLLNLPGRPLLDFPLGMLFIIGLLGWVWTVKRRWMVGWLAVLSFLTLIPSVVSLGAPHTGRAFGLTVVLAVIFGSGALVMERGFAIFGNRYKRGKFPHLRPRRGDLLGRPYNTSSKVRHVGGSESLHLTPRPPLPHAERGRKTPLVSLSPFWRGVWGEVSTQGMGILLLVVLFAWAGFNTLRDFNANIAALSALLKTEQKVMGALDEADTQLQPDAPVYFLSLPYCYPIIDFQAHKLGLRHHGAFLPEQRVVIPDAPLVYYVSLGVDVDLLVDWIQVQEVIAQPLDYLYVQAMPKRSVVSGWEGAPNDGTIAFRLLDVPESASAGETLTLALGMRPLQDSAIGYSVSLSIPELGVASEHQTLLGLSENYLCDGAAPPQWEHEEIVIQRFALPIPDSAPLGEYPIAVNVRYGDDAPIEIVMPQTMAIHDR